MSDETPTPTLGVATSAQRLVEAYDRALASQADSGPDAKMMVMANYGERALEMLRREIGGKPCE